MNQAGTLVVGTGTVSLDTVETEDGFATDVLGGSAPYFGAAARLFGRVLLAGAVGDDTSHDGLQELATAGVDTSGIAVLPGECFRWHVRYGPNGERETLSTNRSTALRAPPSLPARCTGANALFLGSTDPRIQWEVLEQAGRPRLVVLDTMVHWVRHSRAELERLLPRVDVLLLNEEEAVELGGSRRLGAVAARVRDLGCRWLVVKRGAQGAVALGPSRTVHVSAAQPNRVVDPTGAGDAFAGGLVPVLARWWPAPEGLQDALVIGSVMSSFAVESFSVDRLLEATLLDVESRADEVETSPGVGDFLPTPDL